MVLYEDAGWKRHAPLSYSRPTFDLRWGRHTARERLRLVQGTSSSTHVWCRPELADTVAASGQIGVNQVPDGAMLLLAGHGLWHTLPATSTSDSAWVGTVRDEIACLFLPGSGDRLLSPADLLRPDGLTRLTHGIPRRSVADLVRLAAWPWEMVDGNEYALLADWEAATSADRVRRISPNQLPGVHVVGTDLAIGADFRVAPGTVIDTTGGPVWLGEQVEVGPNCVLLGPLSVGDGCRLQPGTILRDATTLGPACKAGGEVETCIVTGYSNKQHHGYLGHALVGEWVNIGAGASNSDLKHTYGEIRVPVLGVPTPTGRVFVGAFLGDHAKIGINVALPSGAMVGFASAVIGAGCPSFVPSFRWVSDGAASPYPLDRARTVAGRVMARRDHTFDATQAKLFATIAGWAGQLEQVD